MTISNKELVNISGGCILVVRGYYNFIRWVLRLIRR